MADIRPFARKKIVIIGGGGGPYLVGSGLREYDVDITIICTPADDGGSSGRIRNEFGDVLPQGDLRRGIMALMDTEHVMDRGYFDKRFEGGGRELNNHSLGNIMLFGAHEEFGRIQGTAYVGRLFGIKGTVVPMSTDDTFLHAMLSDGKELVGETNIDTRPDHDSRVIQRVWLQPQAFICRAAADAIRDADVVIIGPGDLFTSIIPNLLVVGAQAAMKESRAKFICIANQMDKWSETRDYTVADFVGEIVAYGIGRPQFDAVIINSAPIPNKLLDMYRKKEKSNPIVVGDAKGGMQRLHRWVKIVHSPDLLSARALEKKLIRHDPRKLAHAILEVMYMDERAAYDRLANSKLMHQMEESTRPTNGMPETG